MRFVGLIIAIALAVTVGFLAYRIVGGGEEKKVVVQATQPDFKTENVLIASQDISVGDKLTSDMLDTQPWPSHLIVDGFITSGNNSVKAVGMVSRAYIKKGEPLRQSALANPSDPSFLAASLPKGKRVATISTDGIAGIAGFINPGDRVDVMVTHPLPMEDAPENNRDAKQTVAELLLSDIKILAVDQFATSADETDGKKKLPSSVSLEVDFEQAQKLRLAQEVGYVSLALRSMEDIGAVDSAPPITYEKDLTSSDVYASIEANKSKGDENKVTIIRGVEVEKIEIAPEPVQEMSAQDGMFAAPPVQGSVN